MSETKEQKNAKVMIEMQAENKRLEQLCGEFSKGVAKFTLLASKYADEADKLQAELDSLKKLLNRIEGWFYQTKLCRDSILHNDIKKALKGK